MKPKLKSGLVLEIPQPVPPSRPFLEDQKFKISNSEREKIRSNLYKSIKKCIESLKDYVCDE
jgi:hypothetical protein